MHGIPSCISLINHINVVWILSLNFKESISEEAILDYLNNIKEYNDKNLSNRYKKELQEEKSLERKIELAKKALAYKIRSEENE